MVLINFDILKALLVVGRQNNWFKFQWYHILFSNTFLRMFVRINRVLIECSDVFFLIGLVWAAAFTHPDGNTLFIKGPGLVDKYLLCRSDKSHYSFLLVLQPQYQQSCCQTQCFQTSSVFTGWRFSDKHWLLFNVGPLCFLQSL